MFLRPKLKSKDTMNLSKIKSKIYTALFPNHKKEEKMSQPATNLFEVKPKDVYIEKYKATPKTPLSKSTTELNSYEKIVCNSENVQYLAYLLWEKAGCPESDGTEFWLEAERQIRKQNAES